MAESELIHPVTDDDFATKVEKGLWLADFFADWCMPCLMMAPVIDELSEKFKGKIKFGKVSIEDNQELAQKFGIFSIPNFILFKDGKQVEQFIGSMPIEDFEKKYSYNPKNDLLGVGSFGSVY